MTTDTARAIIAATRFARSDRGDAARATFHAATETIPSDTIRRALVISFHATMRAHRYAAHDGAAIAMIELAIARGCLCWAIIRRGERVDQSTPHNRRAVQ